MADPTKYQFDLPETGRPMDVLLNEVWYPDIQAYWEISTSSRIYDAILGVKAVVIHATAGAGSAGAISVMKEGQASFHWLLPDEDEPQHGQLVWACAPEARAAWHVRNACSHPDVNAGATKVNHWSVGIEVVNSQTVRDGVSDWQVLTTARIIRYCWAKYPNLKHVVSHAKLDPARRSDPGKSFPWARLKKLVLASDAQDGLPAVAAEARPASAIDSEPRHKGSCHG
ncbi:MAG: N-acetylmuramoyl-L-alanine amidase [Nitrospira sp.]|jgi:N-acetylmuramoyl-L-alanine amidase|nr:MAG: N-acetylmuramoyl-L-alanine amidase [Nitrospira sp.]